MRIRTRSIEYEAVCLKQHVAIGQKPDMLHASPGEFLLIGPDGRLTLASKAEVQDGTRFEPSPLVDAPVRRRGKPKPGRRPAARKPAPRAAAANGKGRLAPTLRSEKMAEAKRLIEAGKSITDAAIAVAVPYGTVYAWAKTSGWEKGA